MTGWRKKPLGEAKTPQHGKSTATNRTAIDDASRAPSTQSQPHNIHHAAQRGAAIHEDTDRGFRYTTTAPPTPRGAGSSKLHGALLWRCCCGGGGGGGGGEEGDVEDVGGGTGAGEFDSSRGRSGTSRMGSLRVAVGPTAPDEPILNWNAPSCHRLQSRGSRLEPHRSVSWFSGAGYRNAPCLNVPY